MDYYKTIDNRRYDSKLMSFANKLTQGEGDGRISLEDAQRLWSSAMDGGRFTETERLTLVYLMDNFNFTDKAEEWFRQKLHSELKTISDIVEEVVREDMAFQQMVVEIFEEEVKLQRSFPENKVSFENALRWALDSFLKDGGGKESPRSIAMNVFNLPPEGGDDRETKLENRLREVMDRGKFYLLPNLKTEEDWDNFDFPPPQNGENVKDFWIFGLYIPDLSDHTFWALIDRKGKKETYNYGFN
ncbi:MAG: hypothetical protein ACKV1O_05505 [Saprospiraceae bacterium]